MDDELRRHEIDLNKRSAFDYETTKNVVAYRWMKGGGKDEEAKDCFRLFDRRDRGFVGSNDIKNVIGNYLEFPVTDVEVNELVEFADNQRNGQISVKDFMRFYNS